MNHTASMTGVSNTTSATHNEWQRNPNGDYNDNDQPPVDQQLFGSIRWREITVEQSYDDANLLLLPHLANSAAFNNNLDQSLNNLGTLNRNNNIQASLAALREDGLSPNENPTPLINSNDDAHPIEKKSSGRKRSHHKKVDLDQTTTQTTTAVPKHKSKSATFDLKDGKQVIRHSSAKKKEKEASAQNSKLENINLSKNDLDQLMVGLNASGGVSEGKANVKY